MKTQRKPRRLSIDSIITEMSVIEGELLRSIVGGYTDDCFWRCIAYIEDGKSSCTASDAARYADDYYGPEAGLYYTGSAMTADRMWEYISHNYSGSAKYELIQFDPSKTQTNGKIFILDKDLTGDGKVNINDLQWHYLEGDGDFRSKEVTQLRDEVDFIITNPPFSLSREFLAWIIAGKKQFAIISNMNAITYKETFPLIKDNKIWLGATNFNTGMYFRVPDDFVYAETYKFEKELNKEKVNRVPGLCWFTNIDHGRRHQPLPLMSMQDNLRYSKHKGLRGKTSYEHYDNYNAIEVPFTDAIPSDYDGIMGVPISFLDKYCPEQFEIIWQASGNTRASAPKDVLEFLNYQPHPEDRGGCTVIQGKRTYGRILIRKKH